MKWEFIGSAAAGFLSVAGIWLTQYGSSWAAVSMAAIGTFLALLEAQNMSVKGLLSVGIFNLLVGALGGPLMAHQVSSKFELQYPALTLLIAFLCAYVAHDLFSSLRVKMQEWLLRFFGGATK